MSNYKTIRFMSPLTLLGLAACSGGGSSVTTAGQQAAAQSFNIGGNASKGPLQGAIAFIDANGNNIPDAGEVQATTLADGSYILEAATATARVVVVSTDATIDTSSGAAVTDLIMAAPAGATMVTPLTTILDASPNLTTEELQSALGITVDPLTFNPFADGADAAQAVAAEKAAQQIASTVLTATKVSGGDKDALTASVKALASALETAANRAGADKTFDFTDTAELTTVLNAAAAETGVSISAANLTSLASSISNVNQVMEDTLVEGVNLKAASIKNALATVNQFTATIAEVDTTQLAAGAIDVAGFDDIETVKAAVNNAAPTDISVTSLLIDPNTTAVGTASATDGDSTDILYELLGDDKAFFSIDKDSGVITVDKTVSGYDSKSEFSVVIKATDFTETVDNNTFDAGTDVKGKSYSEAFTIVKQNPAALVVSEALTLKDYDVANNSVSSPVLDSVDLTGSMSEGTLKIGSDPVKLNLKNLEALAAGTGGQSPVIALTLSKVPDTSGATKTALLKVVLTDGVDSTADTGERVISLDVQVNYSGDGTNLTLTLPTQAVAGYYIDSDGTKVTIEGLENLAADVLTLTDGGLVAPSSLDVKIASLISTAKENASVDLLQAGKFNLSLTLQDDSGYDGLQLQSATGETITSIEMGINIVDEGEIFQVAQNSVTLTGGGDPETYSAEAAGGILSVTKAIEFEVSEMKSLAAGQGSFPDFSLGLSKVANSDSTAKVRLSLLDGSDTTLITGERGLTFDMEMEWDESASTFTLAAGSEIKGTVTSSDGETLEVTLQNTDADVLSVSSGTNGLSGSSLNVKLGALITKTADFASIDLLSTGNYTLQVETLSGIKLFDATGEEISKVTATVAVVADAPLDVALTPISGNTLTVLENSAATTTEIADLSAAQVSGGTSQAVGTATFEIVDDDSDATNNAFKIVNDKLVVNNSSLLNYESATSINVKIKASGEGRTGTETFKINVGDANDAPVAPTSGLTLKIGAGADTDANLYNTAGTAEFELIGTDEDTADVLSYTITSQQQPADSNDLFKLVTTTDGVKVALTRAVTNSDVGDYQIVVQIDDQQGEANSTTSATLTATVVQNEAPKVTDGGSAWTGLSVDEDATAGTKVLNASGQGITFSGTDAETDASQLTFEVIGSNGSASTNFEIDANGYLVLKSGASINHESADAVSIKVVAVDENGTKSTAAYDADLSVAINDVNDAPTFSAATDSGATLSEFAKPDGTTVYQAAVTDVDDPANTITYSLSGADKDKFAIDANGKVTLASNLDGITSNGSYAFTVTADDGAGGTDTVDVTGTVTDKVDVPFSIYGATATANEISFSVKATVASLDASYSAYDHINSGGPTEFEFTVFKVGGNSETAINALTSSDVSYASTDIVAAQQITTQGYDLSIDPNTAPVATAALTYGQNSTQVAEAEAKVWNAFADNADTSVSGVSARFDNTDAEENLFTVTLTPTSTLSSGTYVIGMSSVFVLGDSTDAVSDATITNAEDIWVTVDIA